jgi:hypothetical protein
MRSQLRKLESLLDPWDGRRLHTWILGGGQWDSRDGGYRDGVRRTGVAVLQSQSPCGAVVNTASMRRASPAPPLMLWNARLRSAHGSGDLRQAHHRRCHRDDEELPVVAVEG